MRLTLAATGSVVLAGHLDSRRFGLGPLSRLRHIEPGYQQNLVVTAVPRQKMVPRGQ